MIVSYGISFPVASYDKCMHVLKVLNHFAETINLGLRDEDTAIIVRPLYTEGFPVLPAPILADLDQAITDFPEEFSSIVGSLYYNRNEPNANNIECYLVYHPTIVYYPVFTLVLKFIKYATNSAELTWTYDMDVIKEDGTSTTTKCVIS